MNYRELQQELIKWKNEGIINDEQFSTLNDRYQPKQFKIPRIHKAVSPQKLLTFFATAIIILLALLWVGQKYTFVNNLVVFASLIFFVIVGLYFGDYVAGRPIRVLRYTGKAIILASCLLTTFTVFYLDVKVSKDMGIKLLGSNWASFMLISIMILVPIAYKMREKVVLAYSLILSVIWFISEGKIYTREYINAWLGMTLPTRLFLLSWIFIGLGYIHKHKVFEKFNPSEKFDNLHKTYYISGLLLLFIPTLLASWGRLLVNPILPLKIEAMVFVILVMALALGCIYVGLIKESKMFFNFGMIFFAVEVYGKFLEAFYARINWILFSITSMIILVSLGSMAEYIIRNKEELSKELLAKKK